MIFTLFSGGEAQRSLKAPSETQISSVNLLCHLRVHSLLSVQFFRSWSGQILSLYMGITQPLFRKLPTNKKRITGIMTLNSRLKRLMFVSTDRFPLKCWERDGSGSSIITLIQKDQTGWLQQEVELLTQRSFSKAAAIFVTFWPKFHRRWLSYSRSLLSSDTCSGTNAHEAKDDTRWPTE